MKEGSFLLFWKYIMEVKTQTDRQSVYFSAVYKISLSYENNEKNSFIFLLFFLFLWTSDTVFSKRLDVEFVAYLDPIQK